MNRHTSDAAVESSHLTGVRRRVSSGSSSSSFDKDPRLRQRRRPSKAVLPQHHGWNRSRVGRHSQVCLFKCHARCDVSTPCFDITTLIRFCQNSPFNVLLFFFRALRRDNRGSGIYKTAAIYVLRKEKRLLTTGQITRYIFARDIVKARCHSMSMRCADNRTTTTTTRALTSFFLSLSLSCLLCKPQAPPASLGWGSRRHSHLFSLFPDY